MRAIVFHRRAARYLSRMPRDRAILQLTLMEIDEVLYVDAIGPRGDIYNG